MNRSKSQSLILKKIEDLLPPLSEEDMNAFAAVALSLKENSPIARQILERNAPFEAIQTHLFSEESAFYSFNLESLQKLRNEFAHPNNFERLNIQLFLDFINYDMQPKTEILWADLDNINALLNSFCLALNEEKFIVRSALWQDNGKIQTNISMFKLLLDCILGHLQNYSCLPAKIALTSKKILISELNPLALTASSEFEIRILVQNYSTEPYSKEIPHPMLGQLLCEASGGVFEFIITQSALSYKFVYNL